MPSSSPFVVQVAVAVIINSKNKVLIAKRSVDQDQGNKWEFPGGKVEKNETPKQALVREVLEEVAIEVQSVEFMMDILHQYSNKKVNLHVYRIVDWRGVAVGNEGQKIKWVDINGLDSIDFPKANAEIISKLQA